MSRPWLLVALVAAPLPALAMGVVGMGSAGVSASLGSQNVVAAVLGALLCVAVATPRHRRPASSAAPWLVVVGTGALAATLASLGIEGIHRWIGVGPLRLHVAATLLPTMLAVLYDAGCGRRSAVYGPIVVPSSCSRARCRPGFGVCRRVGDPRRYEATRRSSLWCRRRAGLGAATLFRSDPLGPVPFVEGIVDLHRSKAPAGR